jgi:hypothetical protein
VAGGSQDAVWEDVGNAAGGSHDAMVDDGGSAGVGGRGYLGAMSVSSDA